MGQGFANAGLSIACTVKARLTNIPNRVDAELVFRDDHLLEAMHSGAYGSTYERILSGPSGRSRFPADEENAAELHPLCPWISRA